MLHWLLRRLDGRALLVYLCFLNDPTHPTEQAEWEHELTTAHESLGIQIAIPNYAPVFIDAST